MSACRRMQSYPCISPCTKGQTFKLGINEIEEFKVSGIEHRRKISKNKEKHDHSDIRRTQELQTDKRKKNIPVAYHS